jgi:hypothetical protein
MNKLLIIATVCILVISSFAILGYYYFGRDVLIGGERFCQIYVSEIDNANRSLTLVPRNTYSINIGVDNYIGQAKQFTVKFKIGNSTDFLSKNSINLLPISHEETFLLQDTNKKIVPFSVSIASYSKVVNYLNATFIVNNTENNHYYLSTPDFRGDFNFWAIAELWIFDSNTQRIEDSNQSATFELSVPGSNI